MLSRVFLAAGVAALAIAAPATAQKGGHGGGGGHGNGGDGGQPAAQGGGGGGGHGNGGGGGGHGGGGGGAPVFQGGGGGRGHGGGGGGAPVFQGGGGGRGHGGGGGEAQVQRGGGHGHGGGFAAPQMRVERQQSRGFERQQSRGFERQQGRSFERQQAHQQGRGSERQQVRQQGHGFERQQARNLERQQGQGFERQQARKFERQQLNADRGQQQALIRQQQFNAQQIANFEGSRSNGNFANRAFEQQNWAPAYQTLSYANDVQVLPAMQVERFVGVPVAQVAGFTELSPWPTSLNYLYPATPNYYYQYGDGYLYQVDRGSNLIAALIPLLAGGYLPGQYLPQQYMASYVPSSYGFNSFYPDYGNVCNRYYYGVVYQVDCNDGYVENVIPMYAGGYGVGQLLPSAYSYYNVPTQYRTLYYDTPDYGYWYSPGAIYQYDRGTSVITSVAALMSPGFTVGQPLPSGYGVYNVPYEYRATYYDTPNAWYRYNNGYIYQVDPVTQLVTAIVASLLT